MFRDKPIVFSSTDDRTTTVKQQCIEVPRDRFSGGGGSPNFYNYVRQTKTGEIMGKVKDNGFRVVGANSFDGQIEEWHFPDLEFAKKFATQTATDVDSEYHIYRHIMTVRRKPQPIECIAIGTD